MHVDILHTVSYNSITVNWELLFVNIPKDKTFKLFKSSENKFLQNLLKTFASKYFRKRSFIRKTFTTLRHKPSGTYSGSGQDSIAHTVGVVEIP